MRKIFARFILSLFGWKVIGSPPDISKYVLIGYPHTSNWDFLIGYLMTKVLRLRVYWIGKDSLFRKPFGGFMRWIGGIPVNRKIPGNFVNKIVDVFRQTDKMIIALAPEGTRQKTNYLKNGFYYMALEAGVPIAMGFLDYPKKRCGIGPSFLPSGDIGKDLQIMRDFYGDKIGRYPEKMSTLDLHARLI